MKKQKSTKRALLMSALSLLVCVSMLVGTTFAWFTDEVKSGTNVIAAGNLDIELTHTNKAVTDEKVRENIKLFTDVDLWEPGAVAYEKLTVANVGDLALKYNLAINVANANGVKVDGVVYTLADVLQVAVVDAEKLTSREAAIAAGKDNWKPLASWSQNGMLYAENDTTGASADTYGIVIYWEPTDNDNIWNMNNGKTTTDGGKQLTIELGVHLTATQLTSEHDSFGSDYDKDAPLPGAIIGSTFYATVKEAIDAAKDGDTIRLTAGTFYEALDLQDKSLTIQGAGKGATIIAGPEDYTTANIPMQSWAGWNDYVGNPDNDSHVYALISANKDVTIKDLTVRADPKQIADYSDNDGIFRYQPDYAFVGIHVQSANAIIENVDIKGIKPDTVTGNDHHNFGLYITSAVNDTNQYTATYKNGKVSDVNRGAIYCWSSNYTLYFEDVTVVGPGAPGAGNGTLTPAAGSENNSAIYAFCSFYVCSPATYENVVIEDSWAVSWWGGAIWNWAGSCAQNAPAGVTCNNCGAVY